MSESSISSVDLGSVGKPPAKASSIIREVSGANKYRLPAMIKQGKNDMVNAVEVTISANHQINKNVDAQSMGSTPRPEQVGSTTGGINIFA